RANREDPKAGYLLSLGTALEHQGLNEQAWKVFDSAVKQAPDAPELWMRLGNVLVVLPRPDPAIASYEHALTLSPRHWLPAHNCVAPLLTLGRFEEALARLDLCGELRPDHAPTMQARAWTLYNLNRFEEALSEGRRARALDPANADICNNLGAALQKLTRHEE